MASTTSLIVQPSTLSLISLKSASWIMLVASNILCGETGWLKRVNGTFLLLLPSDPSDLMIVSNIAGENRSKVLAILTGDWMLLARARLSTETVEGVEPACSPLPAQA